MVVRENGRPMLCPKRPGFIYFMIICDKGEKGEYRIQRQGEVRLQIEGKIKTEIYLGNNCLFIKMSISIVSLFYFVFLIVENGWNRIKLVFLES